MVAAQNVFSPDIQCVLLCYWSCPVELECVFEKAQIEVGDYARIVERRVDQVGIVSLLALFLSGCGDLVRECYILDL